MKSEPQVTAVTYRMASPDDARKILQIYLPFVLHSHTSFEYEVPSVEDIAQRIMDTQIRDPWLIAEKGRELLRYAYAGVFRKRDAYADLNDEEMQRILLQG